MKVLLSDLKILWQWMLTVLLILSFALAALAFVILVYLAALSGGRVVQAVRRRHHVGTYRVRIGPADGRGSEGDDLEDEFTSLEEARDAASATLLEIERDADVAFVLAERDDGEWDVVDMVDVLS